MSEPTYGTYEHMRTWEEGGFRLELFATWQVDGWGKDILAYQLYHHDVLIFQDEGFCPGRGMSIDGDEAVGGLLGFLSLKPGDTDFEYFKDYTPEQMEFAQAHGEELRYLAMTLEEDVTDDLDEIKKAV